MPSAAQVVVDTTSWYHNILKPGAANIINKKGTYLK